MRRVYNVGGGNPAQLREVLSIIEELLGHRMLLEHRLAQHGDPHRTGADTTLARTEFGFSPKVSLADGLRAQFDHVLATRAG